MNNNKEPEILELIQYPSLSQFNDILHFTSTRYGGVSVGNYSSLNLGLYSDDNPENLHENFARIFSKVGIQKCQVFLPFQTHGDIVRIIDEGFLIQSINNHQNLLNGVDAIVTNLPNQFIGVSTADCVPILLYDPVKKAIAAVHAGWRGTCKRIVSDTVKLMMKSYNTNPADLIAVIGPSISPEVYEVSYELVDIYKKEKSNIWICGQPTSCYYANVGLMMRIYLYQVIALIHSRINSFLPADWELNQED